MGFVYKIENKVNGKFYIGSTTQDYWQRWNEHIYRLRGGFHPNAYLQNSWNKYGESNFKFMRLIECDDELVIDYEQRFIDNLEPEYNILKKAAPGFCGNHTKETKKKISDGLKARNYKMPEKQKEDLRKRMMGNKQFLGRKHTCETKEKIRIANSGENHYGNRLTNDDVREIRRLYSTGKLYQREIAEMFCISREHARDIINGKRWSHI